MKPPPRYSAAFSITRFAISPSSRFRNSLIADMRNFAAWGSFSKPPEFEVLAPASRPQFFLPTHTQTSGGTPTVLVACPLCCFFGHSKYHCRIRTTRQHLRCCAKPSRHNLWRRRQASHVKANGTTSIGASGVEWNNSGFSPLRTAGRDQDFGESVPGSREEYDSSLLPVHQPGDDPVRPFLLESGLPILPGRRKAHR